MKNTVLFFIGLSLLVLNSCLFKSKRHVETLVFSTNIDTIEFEKPHPQTYKGKLEISGDFTCEFEVQIIKNNIPYSKKTMTDKGFLYKTWISS